MSQQQLIVDTLTHTRGLLSSHLADFSDAEMLARTSPGANHAAYQLGHLIRITEDVVRQGYAPGLRFAFPPKTANDAKAPPTSDDAAAFATKSELLAGWSALVDVLIAAVAGKSDAELSKPSPESYAKWAPTLGELALAQAMHMVMHVGQIQSIRRKLGKPVLF